MACHPALAGVQCPVGAFAHPVSVGVVDETALEGRFDDLAERVMDHPIPERGGTDQPPFRFVDGEVDVLTRLIAPGRQFVLQKDEIVFQTKLEGSGRSTTPFAFGCPAKGQLEIVPGVDVCVCSVDLGYQSILRVS